jgi:hypothetical protein
MVLESLEEKQVVLFRLLFWSWHCGAFQMLAASLLECHQKSSAAGTPLALRVFISGRGRLENEGSTRLAEAFKVSSHRSYFVTINWLLWSGYGFIGRSSNAAEWNLPRGNHCIGRSICIQPEVENTRFEW